MLKDFWKVTMTKNCEFGCVCVCVVCVCVCVCVCRCTNPGRQVARATKFCTVAPNISGFSVWTFLHITLLAPRIFRRLLDFWKI
jgi:hypothetical protein